MTLLRGWPRDQDLPEKHASHQEVKARSHREQRPQWASRRRGETGLSFPTSTSPGISEYCQPVTGEYADYDSLLDRIGDRRFVLIGEASHGTHDFYRERARITRRLIDERGFTAVAVEADWPDAYRVNRYVMGLSDENDANAALSDFRRFPAWMWRNCDVLAFVEWL